MMRLKELRKERNLTQLRVAALVDITRGAYANIENGKREPDFRTICILADYFGVSADYLLGRSDVRDEKNPAIVSDDGIGVQEQKLLSNFHALNDEGREKLLDYADDLLQSGKYIKADTPELDAEA